jgi:putative PIN family toxin of toxin-antitoxin system
VIRAVIDTNVLVSGLISPSGNEALIILALHQGLVVPCLSEAIIDEYSSVLSRRKFSFPPDDVAALLVMLRQNGEVFPPITSSVVSPDPADTKFLHCALAAKADFIVTGNRRDFPEAPYGITQIVGAGELLDHITLGI